MPLDPFELKPCEESDFADFVRIQLAAFANSGMVTLLYPQPITNTYIDNAIQKHIKSHRTEPDVMYLKVIDTSLGGKMIACAKWRINKHERTEEQLKGQLPQPGPDEEGRPAAQDFMKYLSSVRMKYMGTKPFAFLHILVTDPEHHRRGAGAKLIEWGTERADAAHLPSFLEATAVGRPLYEKMGFVAQSEHVFDLTKYGLQGSDTSTAMIREPHTYVM